MIVKKQMKMNKIATLKQKIPDTALIRCCKSWSLSNPELLFETILADLYRVELPSGEIGALKLFTPHGIEDEWDGALLLEWYGGNGAVEVIALGDGALLMKWLGGGSLMALCDSERVDEAAIIVAELAQLSRNQVTSPPPMKTIERRFEFLFNFLKDDIPDEHVEVFYNAKKVAKQMLANTQQHVPLHGDLHFRNVLFDGEEWRLIDPKGLMGPPAYDLANLFINPWDRPEIVLAKGRAESLAHLLGRQTGYSEAELIGWAIAHAAIAAAWNISNGGSGRHPLRALRVLFDAQEKIG